MKKIISGPLQTQILIKLFSVSRKDPNNTYLYADLDCTKASCEKQEQDLSFQSFNRSGFIPRFLARDPR